MSKKTTIDDLAVMVKNGFDENHKRIDETHKRIDSLRTEVGDFRIETNERFNYANARLDKIEKDVADIRKHFVYRYEFEDLMARVKYMEEKMGIESGK